ncbi:MAG: hypothetical protein ACYCXQ_01000 [Candidatus Humimicrobiaceae bacterium]
MSSQKENKSVPKYIGDFEVYIPSLNRIVKPGEFVPEIPIMEAKARQDFTIEENDKKNEVI